MISNNFTGAIGEFDNTKIIEKIESPTPEEKIIDNENIIICREEMNPELLEESEATKCEIEERIQGQTPEEIEKEQELKIEEMNDRFIAEQVLLKNEISNKFANEISLWEKSTDPLRNKLLLKLQEKKASEIKRRLDEIKEKQKKERISLTEEYKSKILEARKNTMKRKYFKTPMERTTTQFSQDSYISALKYCNIFYGKKI